VKPFTILYVCVGNLCRSVLAERFTRREAQLRLGRHASWIQVDSAGTCARPGEPMHPYTAAVLRSLDLDTDGFAARRLNPEIVTSSDLVLTATAQERDVVLNTAPAALRRTFTLHEFARLSSHLPPAEPVAPADIRASARTVVAAALALRGRMPRSGDTDDIPDPDRTLAAFHACAEAIARSVRQAISALPAPAEPARYGASLDI
jgi:protein-tyrosine phosphatase